MYIRWLSVGRCDIWNSLTGFRRRFQMWLRIGLSYLSFGYGIEIVARITSDTFLLDLAYFSGVTWMIHV